MVALYTLKSAPVSSTPRAALPVANHKALAVASPSSTTLSVASTPALDEAEAIFKISL